MRAILSLSLAALNLAEREETIYGLNNVKPNGTGFWFCAWGILRRVSPPSGEFLFFAPPKKRNQKKGGPEGLPVDAGSLRFSPFRALAELAGFAAPAACKSSSNRAARSIPKWLRCSAAPDGRTFPWACGSRRRDNAVSRLQSVYALQCAPTRQPVELYTRLAQPSIAGKTGSSSRPV